MTLQERLRERVTTRWIHSTGTTPHSSGVKPDALCHEAADRIDALERENAALRQWLSGDAFCPCCGMTDVCAADCTFAAEAPGDAAHMNEVRALLRGGVESPGATGIG